MPRRPMNGVRMHLIITQPQDKALKRMSDKTGLPVSELMRRALDSYLQGQAPSKSLQKPRA